MDQEVAYQIQELTAKPDIVCLTLEPTLGKN